MNSMRIQGIFLLKMTKNGPALINYSIHAPIRHYHIHNFQFKKSNLRTFTELWE
jgi:hypothetical protein